MNSIAIPHVFVPPQDHSKLERWKLTIVISGAVILAPLTGLVLLLVLASVLPVFLLELPLLLARAQDSAPAPRAPLPPQETLRGSPQALPAPT
jgi:hypothetical protein